MTRSKSIGILGGGQLAMMLCQAARALGVHTTVLSPQPDAVACKACDEFLCAEFDDEAALQQLSQACDVVTLETEHIPLSALLLLSESVAVQPGPDIMGRLGDRLTQRGLLTRLNLPQVRFWSVDKPVSVRAAQGGASYPAVLKTRRGGYDGYGQRRVAGPDELPQAWQDLGALDCVLESWLHEVSEFSLVGARGHDGDFRLYPPIENRHRDGQLQSSRFPMSLNDSLVAQAKDAWVRIADCLSLRGVMTVEFFLGAQGEIWVNEIAPRVHNSGHLTQRAFSCSQFEMHVRAVLGMPLPDPGPGRASSMLNLYPEQGMVDQPSAQRLQDKLGGEIVWYGKAPRPRRKMGHWLIPAETTELAIQALAFDSRDSLEGDG